MRKRLAILAALPATWCGLASLVALLVSWFAEADVELTPDMWCLGGGVVVVFALGVIAGKSLQER